MSRVQEDFLKARRRTILLAHLGPRKFIGIAVLNRWMATPSGEMLQKRQTRSSMDLHPIFSLLLTAGSLIHTSLVALEVPQVNEGTPSAMRP